MYVQSKFEQIVEINKFDRRGIHSKRFFKEPFIGYIYIYILRAYGISQPLYFLFIYLSV